MKRFVEGQSRTQGALLPESLDDFVSETNPVRVIDVFVDELDLRKLGFAGVDPAATGRPAYHPAALLKLLVFTLPVTAQFFASVGYPAWLATPVFALELLGGLAMVAGVYARQVALLLLPVMLAAARVHLGNGWVFTAPGGGWEYPLFLAVALLVQWLLGDGAFALRRGAWLVPGSAR